MELDKINELEKHSEKELTREADVLNMGKKGANDDSKISISGHGLGITISIVPQGRRTTDMSWERSTDFRLEPTKFDMGV